MHTVSTSPKNNTCSHSAWYRGHLKMNPHPTDTDDGSQNAIQCHDERSIICINIAQTDDHFDFKNDTLIVHGFSIGVQLLNLAWF